MNAAALEILKIGFEHLIDDAHPPNRGHRVADFVGAASEMFREYPEEHGRDRSWYVDECGGYYRLLCCAPPMTQAVGRHLLHSIREKVDAGIRAGETAYPDVYQDLRHVAAVDGKELSRLTLDELVSITRDLPEYSPAIMVIANAHSC